MVDGITEEASRPKPDARHHPTPEAHNLNVDKALLRTINHNDDIAIVTAGICLPCQCLRESLLECRNEK